MEVASRLLVGERASQAPNDKQELVPTLAAIPTAVGPVVAALAVTIQSGRALSTQRELSGTGFGHQSVTGNQKLQSRSFLCSSTPLRLGVESSLHSYCLVDSGCVSAAAVTQVEQLAAGTPSGTVVNAPVAKTSHHRRVADLEVKSEPVPPPAGASVPAVRSYRLKTVAGKALYKLRQQTVEPCLGLSSWCWGSGHSGCGGR